VTTQILILNMNRIGDLVQTVPLLDRLRKECPDCAIDLVVNRPCAPMAALLPGVRQVFSDDVHAQLGHVPIDADRTSLEHAVTCWAEPFRTVRYDRVINLTFTRRSGWLAAALGVADTRGVVMTPAGTSVVRNPWFTYFADILQYRRVNRFNLVDLFALGGSGHGPSTPLHMSIPPSAENWARAELPKNECGPLRVAVQVGASQAVKAWRPQSFGRTMAAISRRIPVQFVLSGTENEAGLAKQAALTYQTAGGIGTIDDRTGRTDLAQLAALLRHCHLLLTNDTGTMHMAAAVGVRVLNLSLGPISFWETGPYGPGHWVIQPDTPHSHTASQDQIAPEQVAELVLHVLGRVPFPSSWTGVQVYESGLDADGLNDYRQRAGRHDENSTWYRTFWRRFWYDALGGRRSYVAQTEGPPDMSEQQDYFRALSPVADQLVAQAAHLVHLTHQEVPLQALKPATAALGDTHRRLVSVTTPSSAFGPLTVALMRDLQNRQVTTVKDLARQHLSAYQTFRTRAHAVIGHLTGRRGAREETGQESMGRVECENHVPGSELMWLQREQAASPRS
jgi:ADP-heptose:LPS heptosyltransferase